MLHSIAVSLTDMLERADAIQNQRRAVYIYGFELIISTLGGILTDFLIGLFLFREPLGAIVFMAASIPLRVYAGGYHADTYLRCFIISTGSFVTVMILYEIMKIADIPVTAECAVILLTAWYIWKNTPMQHPNQPLGRKGIERCKRRGRSILVAELAILAVLLLMGNVYGYLIWLSMAEIAVFMGVEKVKRGR